MYTRTKDQIIEIIKAEGHTQVKELVSNLNLTPAAIHRALNKLIENKKILKKGSPPKVYYYLHEEVKTYGVHVNLNADKLEFLNKNYLYIDPTGKINSGYGGFLKWMTATNNKQKIENCVDEYIEVVKAAERFKYSTNGLVLATNRFKDIFTELKLDKIYYHDFYSLIKFGKTMMGQYLLHGKQAQDKKIIKQIAEIIKTNLEVLIDEEKIDAIAWVPHSIPRKIPFLKELEKNLKINLPKVELVKVYAGQIPVAQKSLSKIEERIQNAKETILVTNTKNHYKNVLIIDDAVGSGATLNEVAKKLADKGVSKVIGYAIVGSYKGFEVIKEV